MTSFRLDQSVQHSQHGEGRVVADLGATVVVRFGADLQRVEATTLSALPCLEDALAAGTLDDSLATVTRAQALAIQSVNDQWGVFSRSRVQILPHQLWVCRQVTRSWPTRWLVADDVGLGKTIEAGLILAPLLARGMVRRVLVLAPARLVPQWRERLKTMFDIRLQEYSAELDRARTSFWETANQVVASFHTLRQERARSRLVEAERWDMVMVDEAHHFQAEERRATLTYTLLRELEDAQRITSLVLFTGTPHRGRDFGFLALMRLVRADLFDPDRDVREQLPQLRHAMIRNNKALVTDLHGNKIFYPVTTESLDYTYSEAEADFYHKMSSFILDGRAFALSFNGREQSSRMLLLTALQKLAASSICAIRRALERRRAMLSNAVTEAFPEEETEPDTLDDVAEAEENRPTRVALLLLRDEIARLDELIEHARRIDEETKIRRLVLLINERLAPDEPLLLFTEYKATQALVFTALERRFGTGCVGFINGDERLDLDLADGKCRTLALSRGEAAAAFNGGRTRFLVSTEAGGEGIDLQEKCATLVHVDLPWNPMRLHQRVGRLNRYGQKRSVRVFLLRNAETVEARVWELLREKLGRIQTTLSASMEDAEDISELVIGMAGNALFENLFSNGLGHHPDRLRDWFDAQTRQFGGRDAVETVRTLVGNVARYDFQSAGAEIPKLDLPALEPFFRQAMQVNGRRVTRAVGGLSVATPEAWRSDASIRQRYDGLVFDRSLPSEEALLRLVGVGHPLFDRAIAECAANRVFLARVGNLAKPFLVALVEDEVTGTGATVHRVVFGLKLAPDGSISTLRDWETLQRVNDLQAATDQVPPKDDEMLALRKLTGNLEASMSTLRLPFRRPKANAVLALLPDAATRVGCE